LNLLLDMHIRIWSKVDPKRLGKRARTELSHTGNELWLSPVSVWQTLALMRKGRIRVEDPIAWVERAADQLPEVPLTAEIVRTGFALSVPHSDPADRFLAATAKVLKLTLVTAGQNLPGLGDIASLAN
jgi:PIN domain nuclease of toxin-antitoxin system